MSDPTFTDRRKHQAGAAPGFPGRLRHFWLGYPHSWPQLVIAVAWMRGRVDEVSGKRISGSY